MYILFGIEQNNQIITASRISYFALRLTMNEQLIMSGLTFYGIVFQNQLKTQNRLARSKKTYKMLTYKRPHNKSRLPNFDQFQNDKYNESGHFYLKTNFLHSRSLLQIIK